MAEVIRARIRKWFGDRGFGFARPSDAGPRERDRDVFVHARSLDPSLQHLTRFDYPVMVDGRPDFANSPQWPEVFIEAEPGEQGARARRVSDVTFTSGDLGPAVVMSGASIVAGGLASPIYAGPRTTARGPKGPQEGDRRPRLDDKKGGGRRGTWGSSDDDF